MTGDERMTEIVTAQSVSTHHFDEHHAIRHVTSRASGSSTTLASSSVVAARPAVHLLQRPRTRSLTSAALD